MTEPAVECDYIEEVIKPRLMKRRIARALAMFRGKAVEMPARKHDDLLL